VILLNPGPVNVSPRVTGALGRGDLCHREPECAALMASIRERLLRAFAPAGGFGAVLVTGSGTAAVETAVGSVLSKRGRLVIAANGVYGERMAEMAVAARLPHTVVRGEWTAPPDLAAVERALQAPDVEALAVVHNETTTGLRTPLDGLGALARRHGKLLLIDSVSGLAGDPLDLESVGADLVAGTSGKCIQAFPGMGFVLVR
jgi:2-aminoethylphosphonate-pyruvate transaminase